MSHPLRQVPVLLGALLIVVACGGSNASTPPGGSVAPGSTATQGAEATQDETTEESTSTDGGGNGGTFNGTACDLLTTAEVEAASGQPGVKAQATAAGDFEGASQCGYVSNDIVPVIVLTVLASDANKDLNTFKALPGTVILDLNGATGAWVPASGPIGYVVKGAVAVAIVVLGPASDKDPQAVGTQLAQQVADRLP